MAPLKHEWKKSEKQWYAPSPTPQEVTVPAFGFFVLEGQGDPNGPGFPPFVQALYALAYGVRMSARGGLNLPGFFEYTVYPLEVVWDLSAPTSPGSFSKDDLRFRLMIRQPDFVDAAVADQILASVAAQKKLPLLEKVGFERIEEGRCVQMLHEGPYDAEPASFRRMQDFCRKESLARVGHTHREIYLSDPGKTVAADLKTILRIPVRDHFSCD